MNITQVQGENEYNTGSDVSPCLDKKIKEGLCLCFPDDVETFSVTRAWHNTAPSWSLYSEDYDRVISHVGVVDRNIRVGDKVARIAGIQNVFVLPEFRGKGFCDALMNAAMVKAAEYGFDFGLLFCIPDIEKVYERSGWIKLPHSSIIATDESEREGTLPGKNIAMYFPLKLTTFPAGDIHLQGNDW